MLRLFHHVRRAIGSAFGHSVFSMAKAAAYSAILSIFPAMLVVTTIFATMPASGDIRGLLRGGMERILPPDTMQLVQMYFVINHARSVRIVWVSAFISIFAAMGVLLSFMEGFRRAYRLPRGVWGFWRERMVALLLVPGTMIPMAAATVFLAFGHVIERWVIENSGHELHNYVILGWRLVRWLIALLASVFSLMVVYHFGVPREKLPPCRARWTERRAQWRETLPGAAALAFLGATPAAAPAAKVFMDTPSCTVSAFTRTVPETVRQIMASMPCLSGCLTKAPRFVA